MAVQNVYKMKRLWKKVDYHLVFNRTNQTPNNITFIEVINLNKRCKCYGNKIDLYDGGIHKKFAKMNFTSEKGCELNYRVRFTAK